MHRSNSGPIRKDNSYLVAVEVELAGAELLPILLVKSLTTSDLLDTAGVMPFQSFAIAVSGMQRNMSARKNFIQAKVFLV